jgi:flavin-dependent dehydrogenase
MTENNSYDVAIIGGGLAGLSLSIQLADKGHHVILFEKESYPFHKVCGEYISMESWPFLERLGVPLHDMELPIINKLVVTSPDGSSLQEKLPLGGFGISRYSLDALLRDIAVKKGVLIKEKCKVIDVQFRNDQFLVESTLGIFHSFICCGSFGKKSNLDVKWKRHFTLDKSRKLNQFMGIKYHIEGDFDKDIIALHNFKDGYCGISRIEGNKYCLCYLTHLKNLKACDQSITKLEEQVLRKNPHLKKIFESAKQLFPSPVSISQISFSEKTQIENHVILLGDAAGLITPLCGNGMSMAMHASNIAFGCIQLFFQKKITREEMEKKYENNWRFHFSKRLRYGRMIQFFFGKEWLTNAFVRTMIKMPSITKWLISKTHGKPF